MKHITLYVLLFISGLGFSQENITQEVTKAMSKGIQPGIQVFIPNVSEENLWYAIKDVTKPYKGKIRTVKNTDEFFLEGALITEISANPIAIYQIIEKGNNSYTYTAFFYVDGKFIDSENSPEKYTYATDKVQRIALKAIDNKIVERVKKENKNLDNLDNDNHKSEKENDYYGNNDKGL